MNQGLKLRSASICGLVALCTLVFAGSLSAQTKPQTPAESQDDVIRVNTELVQTDVMVFDKKGRFVDGLTGEQFALKVDNKPRPISFFERVTSSGKESQPAAAQTGTAPANATPAAIRGR